MQTTSSITARVPVDQRASAWGSCSDTYDVFAEGVTRPFAEDAVRLLRWPHATTRVLDVAAGTGSFALAAARHASEVLATDFSSPMIERLVEKCQVLGVRNVRTAVMDGQALELDDESFDVVGSLFGLMFFSDHDRGLRELLRVLKPGGQAVVAIWAAPAQMDLMCLLGEAAMMAMCDVPASLGQPVWAPLMEPAKLPGRFRRLGFAQAHVVTVRHVWVFDSAHSLMDLLPSMTPTFAKLVQIMSESQRRVFFEALADALFERQGSGPFALTSEGYLVVATKAAS